MSDKRTLWVVLYLIIFSGAHICWVVNITVGWLLRGIVEVDLGFLLSYSKGGQLVGLFLFGYI